MLNPKELSTLLSIIAEDEKSLENVSIQFHKTFQKQVMYLTPSTPFTFHSSFIIWTISHSIQDVFKVECCLCSLLSEGLIFEITHRMVAYYLLYDSYRTDTLHANPFLQVRSPSPSAQSIHIGSSSFKYWRNQMYHKRRSSSLGHWPMHHRKRWRWIHPSSYLWWWLITQQSKVTRYISSHVYHPRFSSQTRLISPINVNTTIRWLHYIHFYRRDSQEQFSKKSAKDLTKIVATTPIQTDTLSQSYHNHINIPPLSIQFRGISSILLPPDRSTKTKVLAWEEKTLIRF